LQTNRNGKSNLILFVEKKYHDTKAKGLQKIDCLILSSYYNQT